MGKVMTVIPAKTPEQVLAKEGRAVMKVAAYARVSTLHSEQEDSYESQQKFYQDLINDTPGWSLTEIYADQASGLNTKKRTGFQRMMADAKRGKFKLLLVKSISRFGRNTLDTISSIRELRSLGCVVKFQKEALSTDSPQIDFVLTLMSSVAEQESLSISQNTTWGFRAKHSRGEWTMNFTSFLGYGKDHDGNIVIEEEGAETVREIYREFLGGMSLSELCRKLEREGRVTGTGGKNWTKTALSRILSNEKYCGDCLIQKYIMGDVMAKKKVKNEGQAPQYYIEDDHPAIVTRQEHLLAKGELVRRESQFMGGDVDGPAVLFGKNDFTYKIFCPVCGANYNHRNARGKYVWECYNRLNGDCTGDIVSQTEMQAVVLKAAQKLHDEKPGFAYHDVPALKASDDESVLVNAAVLFAENTFAGRTQDFIAGERPTEYSSELMKIVERIDIADTEFTVTFYGNHPVKVSREAKEGAGRRLKRA